MGDAPDNNITEERRGSFGRTFSKIKDAVRRRSLGGKKSLSDEQEASATTLGGSTAATPANTTDNDISSTQPTDKPSTTHNTTMAAADLTTDEPLVVDDNETGEADFSGGPLHSIRSRISSARAKAVFDKYGIKYEEGEVKDPADGGKRIEKAIRIRIHWECHECKTSFSGRKTCAKCGHKRCPDCPRAPAKRVKEILGGTEVMKDIERKADKASEDKDSVVVPVATGSEAATVASAATGAAPVDTPKSAPTAPSDEKASPEVLVGDEAAAALPDIEAEGVLEKDELAPDGEVDVTQYHYVMQTRPRSGVQLVLRPAHSYIRRTCHECQTNFTPKSRHKCLNCGHERCKECPSERTKSDALNEAGEPAGSEQRMVGTVERVYKKPRQRIRWACHECTTVFIGRTACAKCGHERCNKCPRSPSAKAAAGEPSAEVLASVAEKLKNLRTTPSEPVVVTPEGTAVAG